MKEKIVSIINKQKESIKNLPDKKRYAEFVTAFLSVPMMITVLILNFNNLTPKNTTTEPIPTIQPVKEIIFVTPGQSTINTTVPTTTACNKDLPTVTITTPKEGDTISDNPVFLTVGLSKGNYCSVVWSYRINGGSWSDYDDKSISMYNVPDGNVTVDLRVKSIVTGEDISLKRTFTYKSSNPTSPPAGGTPQASGSAR